MKVLNVETVKGRSTAHDKVTANRKRRGTLSKVGDYRCKAQSAVGVAVEMWEPALCAGFQAPPPIANGGLPTYPLVGALPYQSGNHDPAAS